MRTRLSARAVNRLPSTVNRLPLSPARTRRFRTSVTQMVQYIGETSKGQAAGKNSCRMPWREMEAVDQKISADKNN
jgi:hypothetical protein